MTITNRAIKLAKKIEIRVKEFRADHEAELNHSDKFHLDYIVGKSEKASVKVAEAVREGSAANAKDFFGVIQQMDRAANHFFDEWFPWGTARRS